MKYDDASWHYGGEFPDGFPDENGGIHVALFLKWAFLKGWAGELHLEEDVEDVDRVCANELSATEFFFKYCDGKLTDEDFNKEGQAVANRYYGEDGLYLDDYTDYIGDDLYRRTEEEHDTEKMFSVMNARLKSGILTKEELKNKKPSWKFW